VLGFSPKVENDADKEKPTVASHRTHSAFFTDPGQDHVNDQDDRQKAKDKNNRGKEHKRDNVVG
jgi:hypothetical protein